MRSVWDLKFVGKLGRELCNNAKSIPAELLSSWVNNKRRAGGQCTTVKRTITKHLKLLYGENIVDIVGNTTITFMDNCGSFKYWLKDACNKPYWEKLIESNIIHPERDILLPSRGSSSSSPQPPTPPRRRNRSAGTQQPPPSPRRRESNSQLTHEDCLAILGLNWGATEREIKRAYYAKARELHPDRSLLPRDEATARFQILNEAQDQLRGIDRDEPQDEEA